MAMLVRTPLRPERLAVELYAVVSTTTKITVTEVSLKIFYVMISKFIYK